MNYKKIHFIAIGGSVMHNLAIDLKQRGSIVTGSDDEIFDPAKSKLKENGLLPQKFGWDAAKINSDIDCIILGMHAQLDNPELIKAQELGIKIFSFPEFVFELSKDKKKRVVVGGSHGKTTTTSMIMHVLKFYNYDFDYMVGGRIAGFDKMVKLSDAPIFIAEGDEYPASRLDLRAKIELFNPNILILTGLEWDHINIYPSFELYKQPFVHSIQKLRTDEKLYFDGQDLALTELVNSCKIKATVQDYQAFESEEMNVVFDGQKYEMQIFGKHNLKNMRVACHVLQDLGVNTEMSLKALETFAGVSLRMEKMSNIPLVFRDFAHAPSKVNASMEAVCSHFVGKRILAVYELHTFSSLESKFLTEYSQSLDGCEEAIVFVDFHAMELKRKAPIADEQIIQGFARPSLKIIRHGSELEDYIKKNYTNFDVILLMSSGNFANIDFRKIFIL